MQSLLDAVRGAGAQQPVLAGGAGLVQGPVGLGGAPNGFGAALRTHLAALAPRTFAASP